MTRSHLWQRPLATAVSVGLLVGALGAPTVQAQSDATPENPCGTAPFDMSVWVGYQEFQPVFENAGAKFKELHPNVNLTVYATADLRGFEQKLTTALPSGTGGDIIVRTSNFLSRFIDQDLLLPVPDDLLTYVKSGAFLPAVVQEATYNGEIRGVPLFNGTTALFYNKDMLAEANLPGPPTTMDQIWDYASKLAKLDADGNVERSGISLRLSGQGSGVAEKFWILLMQYGKSLISQTADGKWQVDYNGPEGVALLKRYVDTLANKIDSPNIEHDAKAFETLATAMFARESWVITDIALNAPDLVGHYGTISLPTGELGGGEDMFVPKASPNQSCAWEFIKFMTDQEQQVDVVTTAGWTPARADLDLKDFLIAHPEYEGFLNQPKDLKIDWYAPIPEYDEIITKLATHLVDAYADYENLAANPDQIQALMDGWAAETKEILKANDHLAE